MILPQFIDLPLWAASLIIDFPNDNIPILHDENDWKLWGNYLSEEGSFSENNIPSTDNYNDWQSWAQDVYFEMCNIA